MCCPVRGEVTVLVTGFPVLSPNCLLFVCLFVVEWALNLLMQFLFFDLSETVCLLFRPRIFGASLFSIFEIHCALPSMVSGARFGNIS